MLHICLLSLSSGSFLNNGEGGGCHGGMAAHKRVTTRERLLGPHHRGGGRVSHGEGMSVSGRRGPRVTQHIGHSVAGSRGGMVALWGGLMREI